MNQCPENKGLGVRISGDQPAIHEQSRSDENTSWDNTPVLPMIKENDWDTGNEFRYCVNQYSCLTPYPDIHPCYSPFITD